MNNEQEKKIIWINMKEEEKYIGLWFDIQDLNEKMIKIEEIDWKSIRKYKKY